MAKNKPDNDKKWFLDSSLHRASLRMTEKMASLRITEKMAPFRMTEKQTSPKTIKSFN